jgi:hypothetical protein
MAGGTGAQQKIDLGFVGQGGWFAMYQSGKKVYQVTDIGEYRGRVIVLWRKSDGSTGQNDSDKEVWI